MCSSMTAVVIGLWLVAAWGHSQIGIGFHLGIDPCLYANLMLGCAK